MTEQRQQVMLRDTDRREIFIIGCAVISQWEEKLLSCTYQRLTKELQTSCRAFLSRRGNKMRCWWSLESKEMRQEEGQLGGLRSCPLPMKRII